MGERVVQFELTAARAQEILREVSKDSSRVFFTNHADQQMVRRKITRPQVLRCLSRGKITEGPFLSQKGNWEMAVEAMSAGNMIHAAAALDKDENGDFVIVITAYYV